MIAFNVQKFSVNDSEEIIFYGQQNELDYEKYVKFTLSIKEYLEDQGYVNVSARDFENGPIIPSGAIEVFWDGYQWKVVKNTVEQNPLKKTD
ncbi:hypothetical protein KORDIASMS9_03311 [Kordia sp. SMS9]|uniref:hypothetical protein n=1 Tax=Kordia sp. SMS9 TaxID=2282170 RepID=UPI000E0DDADF|nr:hypothetical protein [Kordia sp. SMS9]AXG71056.1 hypothetical protein KORDIASMS9_03311 [Kordia sp. SMS9]